MMETIFDQLPQPGSGLERAYRAIQLEEQRDRNAEQEREAEIARRQQDHEDAISFMQLSGRAVPTQSEWFATVAALSDMEDAREERARGDGHARADQLEERANILRAQRDDLRRFENSRLAVDRARAKAEAAVSARYSSRRSSYR